MRTRAHISQLFVRGDHYESLARYAPDEENFIAYLASILPSGWRTLRKDIWFNCNPPDPSMRTEGWKIHVSATRENCRAVLAAVAPYLVECAISFKVVADERLLTLQLGKGWTRGASGKFMTIYPRDERHFKNLLPALDQLTKAFKGPYILSDRRYGHSGVIYYRYGTLMPNERTDPNGTRYTVLVGPDGEELRDERNPFFVLPPWIVDPFDSEIQAIGGEERTLKDGRYKVQKVIAYSNSGGVYVAEDRGAGGRQVIVKEARPYVAWTSRSADARTSLRREYRILQKLSDTGIAPQPLDCFDDWEHTFLVEELFEGQTLQAHVARNNILARTRATDADRQVFYERWRSYFIKAGDAFQTVHDHGIVFSDISPANVFILNADDQIRIIDFEAAWEPGVDTMSGLYTPGFAPVHAEERAGEALETDFYAFAAMMVAGLFALNGVFELDPAKIDEVVREICKDSGVPAAIAKAIVAGMAPDVLARPSPGQFATLLRTHADSEPKPEGRERSESALQETLARVVSYTRGCATPERKDRLFPGDFRTLTTNSLSLAYGALGTLAGLHRLGEPVPDQHVDWVLAKLSAAAALPPGYGVGTAGIAWGLGDLGLVDEAERLFAPTRAHPLLEVSPGLFNGLAGWGMTALRLFYLTDHARYVDWARAAADDLIARAVLDDEGRCSWSDRGETYFGLMHGSSGVALFLLYLSVTTADERYMAWAKRALQFDLAQAVPNEDGGVSFPYKLNYGSYVCPYWEFGSAGIGAVALRYDRLSGERAFAADFERIYVDLDRKYTMIPGKLNGLAGLAGTMLDAHAYTGEERFRQSARTAIDGILLQRIERPSGIGFPGSTHNRMSCDYGYGTVGIALLIDRYLSRSGQEFLLDEFTIDRPSSSPRLEAAAV